MRPMHFTRFVGLTGILVGCGLVLAAAPSRPQTPPQLPAMPAVPSMPAMPAMPAASSLPALPETPEMPPMPALPSMPAMPAFPALPSESAEPAVASPHNDSATSCEDMHVMFDSEPPIMDSEERTLTKAEASTLRIDNLVNAGVQARGWDKDTYSVTACKFADRRDRDPKGLLSQIKMSIDGGHVSISGPSHSDH